MALAFEKMAARIRDQQGRMGELIAELRTALETRTAYLALQQELEIAQRVQLASLPEALPPTPDLELVGRMLPAREVGGDCYDYFELDDEHIGIVVADVSGKGVPAALFMAIARTLLRALAQRFEGPGPCLTRLNELLLQNNQEELFVTVFYGIFDRRTGRLVYANGGHNPPLMLRDGRIEITPRTGGMALAALDGVTYAERSVEICPGDTILFFTDGITEAMAPGGEEYGVDRLIALLAGCHAPQRRLSSTWCSTTSDPSPGRSRKRTTSHAWPCATTAPFRTPASHDEGMKADGVQTSGAMMAS